MFKTSLRLCLAMLGACSGLHAAAPSIQFGGVTYDLAFSDLSTDGAAIVTNEYVPRGETIDSWTTLLAVRYWPKARNIRGMAADWLKMIDPLVFKNELAIKPSTAKSDQDRILEAWLAAPDRSYMEINLHRFVIEEGAKGVKGYQFAQKFPAKGGKPDPAPFVKKRIALLAELGTLEIAPVKTRAIFETELKILNGELAKLRESYDDRAPSVRSKRKKIAEVEGEMAKTEPK